MAMNIHLKFGAYLGEATRISDEYPEVIPEASIHAVMSYTGPIK